ncbi:hypothetical protein GOBAR_AA01694 [Gossypium barbadense]|uniref:J domain-containing protein n=1 Tax=Gossypium barbadense TaxID=3634 RepID=A0A2P5YTH2_GOSBA|nr:hypothetical protein GOBAR_AA01694 [Gossypium barbadense]
MIASGVPIYELSVPKSCNFYEKFSSSKSNPRLGPKWSEIRCCRNQKIGGKSKSKSKKNYYELLGIPFDSTMQQIKEAYRKLQKKYHPDIAGQELSLFKNSKGHEYTLMLNEAYKVLIKDDQRKEYDASIGSMKAKFGSNVAGNVSTMQATHSKWMRLSDVLELRFNMETMIVSVDSCPVNCIHWVDSEELAVLEFLIQPQLKEGYGVFGGGWERPLNVFMAAKAFTKQLKQQAEAAQGQHKNGRVRSVEEEETPAQAEARANATMKLNMERFNKIWGI